PARRLAYRGAQGGSPGLHGHRRPPSEPQRHRRGDGVDRVAPLGGRPPTGSGAYARASAALRWGSVSIRTQGVIATGVIALLAAVLWINWPDLVAEPIAAGVEAQATPEQIETGEYLARAGNCIGCHTERGQAEYAGGRAIGTPFGNIFSTNLTP